MQKDIAVLLATYNGEKYLEDLIDSILDQTYKDWKLYIRDDNSTDNTLKIIDKYINLYPGKIIKIEEKTNLHGSSQNFICLLENVYKTKKHDIYMFCDQDDVWLKDKIEITVDEYMKIEEKDQPIVIHTDLMVVDSNLNLINKSFVNFSGLRRNSKFSHYLVQNNVTGCTMLFNNKLVEILKYDIDLLNMYDWYLSLITCALGKIIFINKQTVKYRQHSNNVVGAKRFNNSIIIFNRIKSFLKNKDQTQNELLKIFKQAECFKKYYYDMLNNEQMIILDEFLNLKKYNRIKKIYTIIKYKLYMNMLVRILAEFILL